LTDDSAELLKKIESLILVVGRYVSLAEKADIKVIIATANIVFGKNTSAADLLHAIAETGAKHEFMRNGMHPVEFKKIRDNLDRFVLLEMQRVTDAVRRRMSAMMSE